jgi:diguanylate cyclase (GGDEF)-like protein
VDSSAPILPLLQRTGPGVALQDVIDAIPDEVVLLDESGTISLVNVAWRRFAENNGLAPERAGAGVSYLRVCERGAVPSGLTEPDRPGWWPALGHAQAADVAGSLRDLLSGNRTSFECEYPCHSGTQERYFAMHAERLPGGVLIVHRDVTRLRTSGMEAAAATSLDTLTRVLNRYGLAARLTTEVAMAKHRGHPLSAVVVNCDELRAINTHHGVILGDVALAEVARRVRESVRPDDAVARIGGDEFVVLLRGQDVAVAMQVADRIRQAVGQRPISESHGPVKLTVSVAVVAVDPRTDTLDPLLRELDLAMRNSKRVGRNRVTTSTIPPLGERDRRALVTAAMSRLQVAAQDLVELQHGRKVGVELLVRGPRGELESPVDLFRTAVECDLLGTLDEACLRACLSQAHRFGAADVHINVYPGTLLGLWPEQLMRFLAHGARPERICLELCEQQIVGRPDYLVDRLRALRALGFRIAVDDVGFGNSCLESLVVLEPDIVKIDRCFVTGASTHPPLAKNLERLLRVARTLGATSVVEGVEDAADAELARALGAECGQGFLWSRPRLLSAPVAAGASAPA